MTYLGIICCDCCGKEYAQRDACAVKGETPKERAEIRETVARTVFETLQTYLRHMGYPDQVNTGGCFSFARKVAENLRDRFTPRIFLVDCVEHGDRVHAWTYVEETGLHYDSTAVYGAESWRHLHTFQCFYEPEGLQEPRQADMWDLPGTPNVSRN